MAAADDTPPDHAAQAPHCRPAAFPVVGLGASSGGLAALQRFLDHMPSDSGMAFVVVMHLAPDTENHVGSILQRHTAMPVLQAGSPVPMARNTVYILPPGGETAADDGLPRPEEPQRQRGPHVSIDVFFRALAQDHGARAVGVVLSGSGSDGAVGLQRIKEHGGLALVQAPADAEFPEMPRAAMATGVADFVLAASDMPQRLLGLWSNARRIGLQAGMPSMDDEAAGADGTALAESGERALDTIMTLLRNRTGHDFRHYKRATVLRRIERRLVVCEMPDLPAYAGYLGEHKEETGPLLQDMLISVTNFFRDRLTFDALEQQVVPQMFAARVPGEPLRAWVAGCATGEEAYSLSILLREFADKAGERPHAQIFATDIDERALATARSGLYPGGIATDVSSARLAAYFQPHDGGYKVSKAVREPVLFAAHNVLRDPPFSRLDLICCRNLLIYVNREAQASILEMFCFALRPGGYLFLGTSESADAAAGLFTVVDKKQRIYRATAHKRTPRHLPLASFPYVERRPAMAGPVPPRERDTLSELHRQAIEQYAPPSLLVDDKFNILHVSEGAGRFLAYARGVPTMELLPTVHPALRMELRSALFQMAQTGSRVEVRGVPFEQDGGRTQVAITVGPVRPADGATGLKIVMFLESELAAGHAAPSDTTQAHLVDRYEQEVEQLKAHLRETVEHADVSTEELKASNEELQAMVEELRSATEELETSKEELQSMNEELVTVNHELKSKMEETAKVNDDLQNFIVASDIATVFVDGSVRIKRFTPQAGGIFNLISTDVNRPLFDITHRLDYPDLMDDIALVFRELHLVERQVHGSDGRIYLGRIRPYRTLDDKIAGAVLTFVDVTELRRAERRADAGVP